MTTMKILSLGAGVQSSTLLLMALEGVIDRPDCAIFADTQWEPKATYEHLSYLEEIASGYNFTIHRVTAGSIRKQALFGKTGEAGFASLPLHILNLDGSPAMTRRQCTREFKIEPIIRKTRELLGVAKGARVPKGVTVESWQGISIDEASRMKDSRLRWILHRYPLIDLGMSRRDCLAWLESRGYRLPPKSACVGCPFHNDTYWRDMKLNRPVEFADAVEFDGLMRKQWRMTGEAYLHRSLVPLGEVDLSNAEDRGQLNMFLNECEGMCGV